MSLVGSPASRLGGQPLKVVAPAASLMSRGAGLLSVAWRCRQPMKELDRFAVDDGFPGKALVPNCREGYSAGSRSDEINESSFNGKTTCGAFRGQILGSGGIDGAFQGQFSDRKFTSAAPSRGEEIVPSTLKTGQLPDRIRFHSKGHLDDFSEIDAPWKAVLRVTMPHKRPFQEEACPITGTWREGDAPWRALSARPMPRPGAPVPGGGRARRIPGN